MRPSNGNAVIIILFYFLTISIEITFSHVEIFRGSIKQINDIRMTFETHT